jgi:hypothetical protein
MRTSVRSKSCIELTSVSSPHVRHPTVAVGVSHQTLSWPGAVHRPGATHGTVRVREKPGLGSHTAVCVDADVHVRCASG